MFNLFDRLNQFYDKVSKIDTSLTQTSERLSKIPTQLDAFSNSVIGLNKVVLSQKEIFSKSIGELNKVVNSQKEGFEKNTSQLNLSVGSLSKSIGDYEKNINNYSDQLNKIVDATNKQLNILEKQQEIVKKEYERRPTFKATITCKVEKDSISFSSFNIFNGGDIEAEIISFTIFLLKDVFIIKNKGDFNEGYGDSTFYKYRVQGNEMVIPKTIKVYSINGNINIAIGRPIYIPYKLSYKSTYESKSIDGHVFINCD